MRDDHRPPREGPGVQAGSFTGVREIDRDADVLHSVHDLSAERCQPGVAFFEASVAGQLGVVVRQLDDANAEVRVGVDHLDLPAERGRALKVQHHREIARRHDPPDLLDARGDPGSVRQRSIDLPPLVDGADGRLRRFQRGDRREHPC